MSLKVPELLSQKARQVHVDAGKGDTGIHIRMYTYTVRRKETSGPGLGNWMVHVFCPGIDNTGIQRETREANFRNCSTTVAQKDFLPSSSYYMPNIFLEDLILRIM